MCKIVFASDFPEGTYCISRGVSVLLRRLWKVGSSQWLCSAFPLRCFIESIYCSADKTISMLTLHSLIPVKAWGKLLLMILFRKVSAKNRYKHYHEHLFVIFLERSKYRYTWPVSALRIQRDSKQLFTLNFVADSLSLFEKYHTKQWSKKMRILCPLKQHHVVCTGYEPMVIRL